MTVLVFDHWRKVTQTEGKKKFLTVDKKQRGANDCPITVGTSRPKLLDLSLHSPGAESLSDVEHGGGYSWL